MWNEVLKRIDNMITPQKAVKRWDGVVDSILLVNEGINLIYRFEQGYQGYYLRVTHACLRDEKELLAAIAYQHHLFEHHVAVCEPILSLNGLWVEPIQQGQDLFLAHVCREVPGEPIHFEYADNGLYRRWGEVLGNLHMAARCYPTEAHAYTSWAESINELKEYAQFESIALQNTLQEVTDLFENRNQTAENYGLTHGDHREGNVLTDGTNIYIIDFDLPSKNWFMEDLARPFFHPITHNETNWCDKFKPYLEGYLSVMPENSIDLSAFSKQIQMKGLEIYLWTKNNWNKEDAPGGGSTTEWLNKIYDKLVNKDWIEKLEI